MASLLIKYQDKSFYIEKNDKGCVYIQVKESDFDKFDGVTSLEFKREKYDGSFNTGTLNVTGYGNVFGVLMPDKTSITGRTSVNFKRYYVTDVVCNNRKLI